MYLGTYVVCINKYVQMEYIGKVCPDPNCKIIHSECSKFCSLCGKLLVDKTFYHNKRKVNSDELQINLSYKNHNKYPASLFVLDRYSPNDQEDIWIYPDHGKWLEYFTCHPLEKINKEEFPREFLELLQEAYGEENVTIHWGLFNPEEKNNDSP